MRIGYKACCSAWPRSVPAPLWEKTKLLTAVLDRIPCTRPLPCARGWRGVGRRTVWHWFVAKAVHGFETTRQLLDCLRVDRQLRLLCGWSSVRELPHESTLGRAFPEFPEMLPLRVTPAALTFKLTQAPAQSLRDPFSSPRIAGVPSPRYRSPPDQHRAR
jgi:hypothetical protein